MKQGLKPGKAMPKPVIQISESEHSSDSEQEEVSVPRYVPSMFMYLVISLLVLRAGYGI